MLEVDRVHRVRPVDRDGRDAAVERDVDRPSSDGNLRLEELDDLGDRRARREDLGDSLLLERLDVRLRDRPADDDEHVLEPLGLQPFEDLGHERHVRAREDRDADRVGVLLERGLDDLLGRLVEAGVDDLHTGVAQRPRDDLRAPVVPVRARVFAITTRIFRTGDTGGWKYMSVRLRVIGSSPAWPNPGSAQSGYLVEGEGRLLLDCGPGVLARLRAEGKLDVDAIAITHFHLDHWGDVVPWTWLVGYGAENGRPELWVPPGGVEQLAQFAELWGNPGMFDEAFEVREYEDGVVVPDGRLRGRGAPRAALRSRGVRLPRPRRRCAARLLGRRSAERGVERPRRRSRPVPLRGHARPARRRARAARAPRRRPRRSRPRTDGRSCSRTARPSSIRPTGCRWRATASSSRSRRSGGGPTAPQLARPALPP